MKGEDQTTLAVGILEQLRLAAEEADKRGQPSSAMRIVDAMCDFVDGITWEDDKEET